MADRTLTVKIGANVAGFVSGMKTVAQSTQDAAKKAEGWVQNNKQGIGEVSKVFLIYLAIFAPMAIAARAGVRSVATEQMHAAYAMGASRAQVLTQVVTKAALPEIFTGMRIGIGVGWTTLVAAEMVAANRGLGFMVLNAAENLESDTVIMGIFVIGIFAFAFDLLIRYLEKTLIPWKGRV